MASRRELGFPIRCKNECSRSASSASKDVFAQPPFCLEVALSLGSLHQLACCSSSLCRASAQVRHVFRVPFAYSIVGGLKSGFLGVRMNLHSQMCQMIPQINKGCTWMSGNIKVADVDGRLYALTELIDGNRKCYALQVYNPAKNQWKECSFVQFGELDCLIKSNDLLFMFGKAQRDDGSWHLAVERYQTDCDAQEAVAPMHTPRCGSAVVACGHWIYAIGGYAFSGDVAADPSRPLAVAERYHVGLNMWEEIAPMQFPRIMCKAVAINGLIYAVGGLGTQDNVAHIERYDASSNTWTLLASMPTPRCAVEAVVHRGGIYVFGGTDDHGKQTLLVERYNPRTNHWKVLPAIGCGDDVACKRLGVCVTTCNGRLYVMYTEVDFRWPEPQVVLKSYDEDLGVEQEFFRLMSCNSHICATIITEPE